jgi:hypothetical protein
MLEMRSLKIDECLRNWKYILSLMGNT